MARSMRVVRVKHNYAGYRAIRTSEGARREVRQQAERIAATARSSSGQTGYVAAETASPRNRARAAAIAASGGAKRDNSSNNTLIRSM